MRTTTAAGQRANRQNIFRYTQENKTMKLTILPATAVCGVLTLGSAFGQAKPILPLLPTTVSTIPATGDVNPYGVAYVPHGIPQGLLQGGDILVSNFNNSQNLQGTGTTIVRVNSMNQVSLFFDGTARHVSGLSDALGVLANGTVVVGNLPTADGTAATVQPGSLSFIDRDGNYLGSIANPNQINGPWGMAVHDFNNGRAQVFVSNVLNGTVVRFDIVYSFTSSTINYEATIVGSGFTHRTDPAALVLGSSGLLYDAVHNLLYVASSSDNAIYLLNGAGTAMSSLGAGTVVFEDGVHLHGPLQLAMSPTGHLLVANSDGSNADPNQPSELVEFTTAGEFVGQSPVDPNNGGAFGLALSNIGWGTVQLAYVDDNANTLTIVTKSIL
jgi:hypothetical protein